MYLATDPVWKAKVGDEVQKFIARYAPGIETIDSEDQIDNLAAQLSKVPGTVWEEEMEEEGREVVAAEEEEEEEEAKEVERWGGRASKALGTERAGEA